VISGPLDRRPGEKFLSRPRGGHAGSTRDTKRLSFYTPLTCALVALELAT
jgi:hypothetical protein